MKFLSSTGGHDELYGVLTTPGHKGIPLGIINGKFWAADNQAYTKKFNEERFFKWLVSLAKHKDKCLFVTVPDVVGNAKETLDNFEEYRYKFIGWPIAFVGQDGQENLELPLGEWDCFFLGGTTQWKTSKVAFDLVEHAYSIGKRIHIGRVNYRKRYMLYRTLNGSDNFTCDGTRQRYEGKEKAYAAWISYQNEQV